ncbi:RNA polymerase II-associated protein 3-like [Gigantopelta aegis]|uniref:RNA polymerase II-associated protein 3-like n=1 Tax=Gigantopelta aegis TaxID=1735272 RepID=UPI001B88D727|nr:RNA polymerase II-associated protein 3-like [Gigantopelta aegis]
MAANLRSKGDDAILTSLGPASRRGNEHFKQGVYESAVESYTRGIHLDPTNAILPANRAMAYLKQHRYAEAVVDCTTAISLDPLYIKAYLRRASARLAQHYMEDAMADYDKVLTLEPHNKLAHCEKSRIQKEIANRKDQGLNVSSFVSSERGVVKPVYKAPEQRSKKPLRRLNIEEIGHVRDTGVKESAKKNQVKKLATCEDSHLLDPLISENTTCTQNPNSQLQGLQLQCSQGLQLQSSQLSHSQLPALQLTKSQLPINRFGSDSADCLKADNRPSSGTSVQVNSDMDRGVPQSSFQFQADYKVLKNKPEAFYKYFKQIEPSSLSTLFGHAIDADIILKIFTIFRDFFIPDGLDVLQYVHHLAQVNRFDMALMFLSPKEKQVLSDVFDHLRRHSSSNDKDLSALARRYQLSATR